MHVLLEKVSQKLQGKFGSRDDRIDTLWNMALQVAKMLCTVTISRLHAILGETKTCKTTLAGKIAQYNRTFIIN